MTLKEAPTVIKVPLSASHLHTPLIPARWTQALTQHPLMSKFAYSCRIMTGIILWATLYVQCQD